MHILLVDEDRRLQTEMQDDDELIVAWLVETVADIAEGEVYLDAFVRLEAETVLHAVEKADSLLACNVWPNGQTIEPDTLVTEQRYQLFVSQIYVILVNLGVHAMNTLRTLEHLLRILYLLCHLLQLLAAVV